MADIAPAINAFATGYGISRTNRLDKETSQSNALSRKVTETNLLRQQQSDTGKLVTSLDTAFAKAAQWADTPEKWPAVQQYMGNAIQQATQFGLPPDLAQKFAEAVTQTSYEQRGPIAAQAGLPGAGPETYGPVGPIPGAPEGTYGAVSNRGRPLITNKPSTSKTSKILTTADSNGISREVDKRFEGLRNPITQELMRYGDPSKGQQAQAIKTRAEEILIEARQAGQTIGHQKAVDLAFQEAGNAEPEPTVPRFNAKGERIN